MADQLSLQITTPGADAAVAALRNVQQAAQQTAQSINALSSNLGGATTAAGSAGASINTLTNTVQQHAASVNNASAVWLHLGGAIGGLPGPLGSLGHAFAAVTVEVDRGALAMTALGGAIAGALGDAVHATLDFQQQMGILRATLPVADVQQFGDQLTALAQKLGQETVFSSTQAIEAMGGLARAGLSTSDILGGVAKSTLDMAAAMGSDPKEAALALGAALREFNLTAADAPRVADLFSQAVHVAGLSADGLRTALGQAGPIIRAMGGDLTDAVTGIELLTRSGVSAGKAGTQLAQLYQDVVNPRTKEAAAMMQQLGFITAEGGNKFLTATGQVRPFAEVAQILSEGLARLTPQQEALATQTEFSRRAMLGAMIVANQYATGGLAALTEAQHNARTAAQAMAERLDNLWGSVKQLSSSIQTLAVDIGSALAPALKPVIDGLKDLVNGFIALGPEAHTAVAAVAGVEAVVLTLGGTAAIATTALGALGLTIGAIAPPLLAVAAVTAAFVVAWQTDFMGIQEGAAALGTTLYDMWLSVASVAIDAWNMLLPVRDGLQNFLVNQLPPAIQFAQQTWTAFTNEVGPTFRMAWEVIQPGLSAFKDWLGETIPRAIEAMRGALAAGLEALINFVSPIADAVGGALHEFNTRLQEGLASIRQPIVQTAGETGVQARQAFIEGVTPVVAETQTVAGGVSTALGGVNTAAGAAANGIELVTGASHRAKTAAEEHKAALQALVQSTDAVAVSQGLYEQHLDAFIEKTAASLPAIEGQVRALINAGDSMGALRVEAQALGLSDETLIQASQGVVAAQNAVKAAVEATTGSHEKAKTAAKTHAEAIRELAQSSDASLVAIGLADQAYDKFASATLPKLAPALAAQVTALRNAGESAQAAALAANAYGFSLGDVNRMLDGNIATTARWNAALKGEAIPAMNSYAKAALDLNPNLDRAKQAGAAFGLTIDHASEIVTRAAAIQKEWQAALKEDEAAGRATGGSMLALRDSFQQAAEEIARAANKASNAGQQFRQVGGYIQDGIRVGFQDFSSGELWQRVNGGLQALHDQAMDALRAHSPSQLWAEDVGRPMAEGIGVGFTTAIPSLVSTIQGSLQQVVDTASDYGRRAAGAFDTGLVFSGGSDQQSRSTGAFTLDAAQRYAQLYTRETGYSLSSFGLGPEGRAVDVQKQAQAFQDAQKSYWESQYGTTDPAKAQAAYLANNPAARTNSIYQNLLNQSGQSLFSSLISKLPLGAQAQYQQIAAGDPDNMLDALSMLWRAGGGSPSVLWDKLNNIEQPGGYNPLLGPSANALLSGASGGSSTSSPGGNLTGTSGSGFATSPISFYDAKTGVLPSGGRTLDYGDMARNAADFSKALASLGADVPIVSLSWSSIKDWSKQADNSMAHVAGAFSAIPLDLNSKMLSSITGAWTQATIGGPSGPNTPGPGSGAVTPSGNTYGGQSFGALQTLVDQITKAHPDLGPDAQARAIQDGMRTNSDYLRVVGNLTDTTSDLQRQQADATNEVFNWTNVVNQGIPAAQELADAQAKLAAVTNQLAATVTAPVAPSTPPPPNPVQVHPPEVFVAGHLPGLTQGESINTPTPILTPTPTVTLPPTSTPTPPPPPTPVGPRKIGTTATGLDVYQMPDGSIVRVPTGSPPPGTTPLTPLAEGGIVTAPTRALIGEAGPEAVIPLNNPRTALQALNSINQQLGAATYSPLSVLNSINQSMGAPQYTALTALNTFNTQHGLPQYQTALTTLNNLNYQHGVAQYPTHSSGGGAPVVNLTANITLNNAASTPQLAAVLVRQIREEFRRQGTDVSRLGGF